MIILAQVFSAFLGSLVIAKSYSDLRRGKENIVMFIFWTSAWLGIVAIAFFPQIVNWLINNFGGQRTGLGTVFGLALTFLFFVLYRVYIKADRVEKEIHKLIREIAISEREDFKK